MNGLTMLTVVINGLEEEMISVMACSYYISL